MRPKDALIPLLLCGLLFTGCSSEDASNKPSHDEETGGMPTNRVAIPPTVRSNLGITFAPVERRRVEQTLRIPGVFELQPLARREYRMVLPGEVELAVDQYQRVEAGDVLYRFRSPTWPELQHEIITAEQSIQTAKADIALAQTNVASSQSQLKKVRERLGAIKDAGFRNAELALKAEELQTLVNRSQSELVRAETELDNAWRTHEHAMHRAASATGLDEADLQKVVAHEGTNVPAYRTIDWITVRAARPGIVEQLAVTDGAYAEVPTMVLSTVDLSRLRFHAEALQSDMPRLTGELAARIVPVGGADTPEQAIDAEVSVGINAHPDERTVSLIATPNTHQAWARPGVSAFLEVVTDGTAQPALAIPRAAVVKDGIVHVFFRRDPNDPNKAIRVEADMGVDDGTWVAINSGLSLNDEVVLDGAYELKLATQQSGTQQKGGHFHADGTFHETDEH